MKRQQISAPISPRVSDVCCLSNVTPATLLVKERSNDLQYNPARDNSLFLMSLSLENYFRRREVVLLHFYIILVVNGRVGKLAQALNAERGDTLCSRNSKDNSHHSLQRLIDLVI